MATVGQMPVRRWTTPASASFSQIVCAAPGCAKTLNRVPESPYPQDGVSTRSPDMRSITESKPSPEPQEGGVGVRGRGSLFGSLFGSVFGSVLVKVEDLREQLVESG